MGEAAFQLDRETPDFESVAWPELVFSMDEGRLFGDGLPSGASTRLRKVVQAIQEVAPAAVSELHDAPVTDVREEMDNFLDKTVTIKRTNFKTREFIDPKDVCTTVWLYELIPTRHPILQAWNHVYFLNQKRTATNAIYPGNPKETLVPWQIDQLALDLIFSLKHETIREMYAIKIKQLRELAKER
jgi:hypothetical protein